MENGGTLNNQPTIYTYIVGISWVYHGFSPLLKGSLEGCITARVRYHPPFGCHSDYQKYLDLDQKEIPGKKRRKSMAQKEQMDLFGVSSSRSRFQDFFGTWLDW